MRGPRKLRRTHPPFQRGTGGGFSGLQKRLLPQIPPSPPLKRGAVTALRRHNLVHNSSTVDRRRVGTFWLPTRNNLPLLNCIYQNHSAFFFTPARFCGCRANAFLSLLNSASRATTLRLMLPCG